MLRTEFRRMSRPIFVAAWFILFGSALPAQELVDLKLTSTKRGYDTVTNPPSGAKQNYSIPKAGILTVIHTIEPYPSVTPNAGGFRMFPIMPKNGPDWEARHHLGTTISSERTPKDPKPGDVVTVKTVYRVQPTPAEIMMAVRLGPPLVFQAFQIGNRGEQLGAIQTVKVLFSPLEEYSKQDKSPPQIDIGGTWTHGDPFGPKATWTFTPKGNGEYDAVEKGFENAKGTAKVHGKTIYIDYSYPGNDGKPVKGVTVITMDDTNKNGSGWFLSDVAEGGARIWSTTPAKPIGPVGETPATPGTPVPGTPGTGPTGIRIPEPANVNKFTVQVGHRQGRPGETILVPVYLLSPGGVGNLNLTVTYSSSVARAEGKIVRGNVLGNALFEANAGDAGEARIGIAGTRPLSESGTLAQIPFKVTGKPGDRTDLVVTVTTANAADGTALTAGTLSGSLTVLTEAGGVPGDADGDNVLTAGDALAALKMSVKLIPEKKSADIDNDGKVTSNDARLILQRVVGK